jgi:hypothetical protein
MSGGPFTLPDDEDRLVDEMTRELEGLAASSNVVAAPEFPDRVMATVATQPLPQPVRAFGLALGAGRLRAAAAAIGDSWRVITSGFVPASVRAQALALVLAVSVLSLGVVGGTAAAAAGLLAPQPSTAPTIPQPSVPLPPSLAPLPTPGDTAEPTDSAQPSETPEPSERATSEPTEHAHSASPAGTGTDNHGGGSGSGTGSGSGGRSESASPGSGDHGGATETPEPTETAEPTETDDPTSSGD